MLSDKRTDPALLPSGSGRTGGARSAEELDALALGPEAKEIADYVRSKLPAGAHFAVFVLPPPPTPGAETRVIAITSKREIMARAVGSWLMNVLGPATQRRELIVDRGAFNRKG